MSGFWCPPLVISLGGYVPHTFCSHILPFGKAWSGPGERDARRLDDPRDLVRVEVAAALSRDIPVIPLLVGGAEMPAETELPQGLRTLAYRNGIAVRPDPDFHKDLDRLITGLEAHFSSEREA